eukprot:4770533-Amphidinium_carterae.1
MNGFGVNTVIIFVLTVPVVPMLAELIYLRFRPAPSYAKGRKKQKRSSPRPQKYTKTRRNN